MSSSRSASLPAPGARAGVGFAARAAEHPLALAALIGGFTLLRLLLAATAPLLAQEAYYWS